MPCCSVTARLLLLPHSSVFYLSDAATISSLRRLVARQVSRVLQHSVSLVIACDQYGFNLSVYNKKRQEAPSFFLQSAPSIPCPPPQPSALSSLLIQGRPALLTRASGCCCQSAPAGLCAQQEGWAATTGSSAPPSGWRERRMAGQKKKGNKQGGTGVNPQPVQGITDAFNAPLKLMLPQPSERWD